MAFTIEFVNSLVYISKVYCCFSLMSEVHDTLSDNLIIKEREGRKTEQGREIALQCRSIEESTPKLD